MAPVDELTSDQRKKLLAAGYQPSNLRSLTRTQLNSLISQAGMGRSGGSGTFGKLNFSAPITQERTNIIGGTAIPNPSYRPVSNNPNGSTLFKALGINPGEVVSGVGAAIANVPATAKKIVRAIATGGNRRDGGKAAGSGGVGKPGPAYAGMGGDFGSGYNPDPYSAPELTIRDFTDQARQQVGDIYSPRYAAIDAAIQRAQDQYGRSRQIVGGLYENLAKSVAQTAEDTKARYGAAAAEQQARTDNTRQQVAQNYSSTQNQEAALLQQLGQQEAAQNVLSDNSAESAYQQSQVDREGQAQLANNSMQGNAQQDYLANVSDAHQTGGAVAQQDLLNQLQGVQGSYEQDRFNLQGDQAQAALQLAQQLSDRDYQAQAQNAQLGMQAYGINNQNAQFQAQQQQAARTAQQEMMFRLQQAQQDQSNQDREFNLRQANYTTDLATSQAQLALDQQKLNGQSGYQGLDVNDQDPASRTMAQIANATGGDTASARTYYDAVGQAIASFDSRDLDTAYVLSNQFEFVSKVGQILAEKGLNPVTAQSAAAAYWSNLIKGK